MGDRPSGHALKVLRAEWPHPGRPALPDWEALEAARRIGTCHAARDVAKAISGQDTSFKGGSRAS